MSPLDLVAVVLGCGTLLASVWMIAERWYAHRDRSYAQLTKDTQILAEETIALVAKTADDAAERLDAHVAERKAVLAQIEADVKQLKQAEQERIRSTAFGGRR